MGQRGKKSVAELSVTSVGGVPRIGPPANLTQAQKAIWVSVVNARPAEWFGDEHVGMLAQYCRHKVQADVLAQQIEVFDPEWLSNEDGLRRYDKLSAMMERETRTMNALLRSMRLTQQSLIRAEKAVNPKRTAKPWEKS